jgi:hypothetical protein
VDDSIIPAPSSSTGIMAEEGAKKTADDRKWWSSAVFFLDPLNSTPSKDGEERRRHCSPEPGKNRAPHQFPPWTAHCILRASMLFI